MKKVTLPTLGRRRDAEGYLAGRANATAAIDTETLFNRCMGNVSFALTLLSELETNGMKYVQTIAQHSAAADCAEAAEAAHAVKGAAGILGAESLRSLAAEIEGAGKVGDLDSLVPLVEDLRQEMGRCLAQIPKIREQAQNTGN
ncbi:MAG: Hpt domain-containing protein [Pirellulaceae bacterium]